MTMLHLPTPRKWLSTPRTEKWYNRRKSQISKSLSKNNKITVIKREIAVSNNSISVKITCSP